MSAHCPCCGEPETCLDDCTFRADCPDQVAELSAARGTAALRHELAELRAAEVDLRRENALFLRRTIEAQLDLATLAAENAALRGENIRLAHIEVSARVLLNDLDAGCDAHPSWERSMNALQGFILWRSEGEGR